jgi:hypothetical protein
VNELLAGLAPLVRRTFNDTIPARREVKFLVVITHDETIFNLVVATFTSGDKKNSGWDCHYSLNQ